ncbi:hypothetical protein Droror1_Dr00009491 [Drosera rotundifolia]
MGRVVGVGFGVFTYLATQPTPVVALHRPGFPKTRQTTSIATPRSHLAPPSRSTSFEYKSGHRLLPHTGSCLAGASQRRRQPQTSPETLLIGSHLAPPPPNRHDSGRQDTRRTTSSNKETTSGRLTAARSDRPGAARRRLHTAPRPQPDNSRTARRRHKSPTTSSTTQQLARRWPEIGCVAARKQNRPDSDPNGPAMVFLVLLVLLVWNNSSAR